MISKNEYYDGVYRRWGVDYDDLLPRTEASDRLRLALWAEGYPQPIVSNLWRMIPTVIGLAAGFWVWHTAGGFLGSGLGYIIGVCLLSSRLEQ